MTPAVPRPSAWIQFPCKVSAFLKTRRPLYNSNISNNHDAYERQQSCSNISQKRIPALSDGTQRIPRSSEYFSAEKCEGNKSVCRVAREKLQGERARDPRVQNRGESDCDGNDALRPAPLGDFAGRGGWAAQTPLSSVRPL